MKKTLAIFGLCVIFSTACYAQMTWYPPVGTWSGPAQLNNEIISEQLRQSGSDKSDDDGSAYSPASIPSLNYTPQKSRTRANLQNFVEKTRAVDPSGAAQMEQEFASGDFMAQIGDIMSSVGLSKNNVADAYALYWVNAWQVAHGDSSTPSAEMMQAVAAQAARGLSQSPEFAAANEAQKQEMAEALMVQGVMIASAFEQARGDRKMLRAIGQAVAKGASASGLELDTMTLTEEGFVEGGPSKGADASGLAVDESKLASATDGGKTLQYGIMAALGLGAAFMIGKGMRKA
jgi:hypothetical protein